MADDSGINLQGFARRLAAVHHALVVPANGPRTLAELAEWTLAADKVISF